MCRRTSCAEVDIFHLSHNFWANEWAQTLFGYEFNLPMECLLQSIANCDEVIEVFETRTKIYEYVNVAIGPRFTP